MNKANFKYMFKKLRANRKINQFSFRIWQVKENLFLLIFCLWIKLRLEIWNKMRKINLNKIFLSMSNKNRRLLIIISIIKIHKEYYWIKDPFKKYLQEIIL